MKLRFKDQRGISLIEVMVVLGVSGIIVTGVAKFLTGQMKARQAIGSRNDVSAARRAITELFSCEKSLNVAPGTKIETCGDYPMIDKRGNALVGKSGQFGSSPVFLKMRCDDQGMGIAFDYQLGKVVSGAVTALPDPSNGNKAGFVELLPGETFCVEYFSPVASSGTPKPEETPPPSPAALPGMKCYGTRIINGIKGGVPSCGYSAADLRGPATCTAPSTTTAPVCKYSTPSTLPSKCQTTKTTAADGTVSYSETCSR